MTAYRGTMSQISQTERDDVVLLNEDGTPMGAHDRLSVHGTDTPLHLAFSLYVFDEANNVLLTRRALSKKTWPGVWTNSCCGHPKPGEDRGVAVQRRIREELGLTIEIPDVVLPDFRYRALDASGIVENEICPVYAIRISRDAVIAPNPDEVMDHTWVPWQQLVISSTAMPETISPWAAEQIPQLARAFAAPRVNDPADTPLTATMAAVDCLLEQSLSDINERWTRFVLGENVDVDGTGQDLPGWLATLTRNGGKRFRTAMCHWGFVASGGVVGSDGHATVVRAGAALEALHLFALLHDDIMDESDTRRGEPSAHRQVEIHHRDSGKHGNSEVFGRNLAILVGDLAHAEADQLAGDLPESMREDWYELKIELIAGQRADLTEAASGRHDIAQSRHIAQLKSGSYTISRPLELGAKAAGASDRQRSELDRYGHHIGRAFALRDDYLGIWGDPEITGKPSGDDLRYGKATVMLVLADGLLDGPAAEAMARVDAGEPRDSDVATLQQALIDCGVQERVETMIHDEVTAALTVLSTSDLSADGVAGLTDMATRVAWRNS